MRPLKQTRGKPAGKGSHSLLKGPKAGDDSKGKSGKLTSTKNKIRGVERLLRKVGGSFSCVQSPLVPVTAVVTGWDGQQA